MVSALLEVEDCSESDEQAAIHGSLGSGRPVSRSPCIKSTPNPGSKSTDEHIGRVAVAVAYQHCLEECVTDD